MLKIWKEDFEAKLQADQMWDRLMKLPPSEQSKEKILSAMEVCDSTEQRLLETERRIRAEKIEKIPYDQNSPQNLRLEERRKVLLKMVEEIMEQENGSEKRKDSG